MDGDEIGRIYSVLALFSAASGSLVEAAFQVTFLGRVSVYVHIHICLCGPIMFVYTFFHRRFQNRFEVVPALCGSIWSEVTPTEYCKKGHPTEYHEKVYHTKSCTKGHPTEYHEKVHPTEYHEKGHTTEYCSKGHPTEYCAKGHLTKFSTKGHLTEYSAMGHLNEHN